MKKGVGIVDQKITFYLSKTKSRKWTTMAFWYLVDICRINAASVLAMNKHTELHKQNLFEVGFCLVFCFFQPFFDCGKLLKFFKIQGIFRPFLLNFLSKIR